jgi:hypothetical protein
VLPLAGRGFQRVLCPDVGPEGHCAQVARPTEAEAELENDGADELPASAQ